MKFTFILIINCFLLVNFSNSSSVARNKQAIVRRVPKTIPPSMATTVSGKIRVPLTVTKLNVKKSPLATTIATINQTNVVSGLRNESSISGRIIGGTVVTSPTEFPWQAYLSMDKGNGYASSCGGTLIDSQWVLTAAHCLYESFRTLTVYLGARNVKSYNEPNRIVLKSSQYYIHPQYQKANTKNDIALIRLPVPITFNNYIRPARLPDSDPLRVGDQVTVTGWGKTSDVEGSTSAVLLKAQSTVINTAQCKKYYPNADDSNICTSGGRSGGSCNGDSGGPLSHKNADGTWTVVGAVSYGHAKCTIGWPDVYTRVSVYLNWIYQYVKRGQNAVNQQRPMNKQQPIRG